MLFHGLHLLFARDFSSNPFCDYFLDRLHVNMHFRLEFINERFAELRKACGKSQTEFGKILGIRRAAIANIESGVRTVTEQHLRLLEQWEEYPVNIDWLVTGKGNMFFNSKSNALTSIRRQYHLTDAQYNLFVNFLELPEKSKKIIFDLLESSFSGRVSSNLEKNSENSLPESEEELAEKYVIKDVDEENA